MSKRLFCVISQITMSWQLFARLCLNRSPPLWSLHAEMCLYILSKIDSKLGKMLVGLYSNQLAGPSAGSDEPLPFLAYRTVLSYLINEFILIK